MAVTIQVSVSGLRGLTQALNRYPQISKKYINKALDQSGRLIEREAKAQAPVDTGVLRNRIIARRPQNLSVRVSDQTEYGIYVHEGTSRITPNPFFTRSVRRRKREIVGYMARAVQLTFREVANKAR